MLVGRGLMAVAMVLVALGQSGCSLQHGLEGTAGGGRSQAPPLAGTTLDGGRHVATRGHPLVVDFWASWCGPCRAEQVELNSLRDRYAPRGVEFLGVDLRDDTASARAFVREFGVAYPSIIDDGSVAGAFDVAAPPEAVVVDGRGRITRRLLGTTVGIGDSLDQLLR